MQTSMDPKPSNRNWPLLVGLPEVAKELGISRSSLRRLIKRRELPVRKVGGRTLVRSHDLEAYVASNAALPPELKQTTDPERTDELPGTPRRRKNYV